jgi:hypothetical protein
MESFVTCVLYVVLDQYPGTPAEFVQPQGSRYREIPTVRRSRNECKIR